MYISVVPFQSSAALRDLWRTNARRSNMASVTTRLSFMIIMVVMLLLGGLFALLKILRVIITRPFTVFKKVHRNGKVLWRSQARGC